MKNNQKVANQSIFMRMLSRLFRPFYSVEKKSSEDQLREDFGEFPPSPLRCQNLKGNVKVVRLQGVGEVYQDFVMARILFNAFDSGDIDSLSNDIRAAINVEKLMESHRQFRDSPAASSPLVKAIMAIALSLLFIKKLAMYMWYGSSRATIRGMFTPFRKDESQIIIRTAKHMQRSDAPTVSHEHIHLLQHKSPERHRRNARSLESLVGDESISDVFVKYVFEKKEVEARLHELVVCFYRSHRQLPVTVHGFMGLLAASENIGGLIEDTLDSYGVPFDQDLAAYSAREEEMIKQFAFILVVIRTPELRFRFIHEVLPVMYGNLLYYYGEDVAEYQSAIQRPNFYDELYGELDA